MGYFFSKPVPEPTPEELKISQIEQFENTANERTHELVEAYPAQIEDFLENYPDAQPDNEEFVQSKNKLGETHARISELLLQVLFKIDGVECPSEMPLAKEKRKAAVRNIQKTLTEADQLWDRVKKLA